MQGKYLLVQNIVLNAANNRIKLISLIGIAFLLRFFMLSNQSLWFDEAITINFSSANFGELVYKRSDYGYQSLYYLIMFYWRWAFGDSEWALRSLSALLGGITIVFISLTACRLYDEKQALWSTALATVSAFSLFYSQDARPYALLLCLASAQLYFFSSALSHETRASRWGFWLTSLIASWASILLLLFTAALSLSHLIVYQNWRQWRRWWLSTILFILPIGLLYLSIGIIADNSTISARHDTSVIRNAAFALYAIAVGLTYGPPTHDLHTSNPWQVVFEYLPALLLLGIILFVIFLLLIKILFTHGRDKQYHTTYWFLFNLFGILFIFAFLLATVGHKLWLPRHSFYLWIPFVLLIPAIINLQGKIYFLAKIVLSIFIMLNLYASYNYFFEMPYRKDDYRAVAQYINTHRETPSVIIWGAEQLLSYYDDNKTLNGTTIPARQLANKVKTLTQSSQTVFIIVNNEHFWQNSYKTTVVKAMEEYYIVKSVTSFPNFKVYLFHLN